MSNFWNIEVAPENNSFKITVERSDNQKFKYIDYHPVTTQGFHSLHIYVACDLGNSVPMVITEEIHKVEEYDPDTDLESNYEIKIFDASADNHQTHNNPGGQISRPRVPFIGEFSDKG